MTSYTEFVTCSEKTFELFCSSQVYKLNHWFAEAEVSTSREEMCAFLHYVPGKLFRDRTVYNLGSRLSTETEEMAGETGSDTGTLP